jgi:hypothetical protein
VELFAVTDDSRAFSSLATAIPPKSDEFFAINQDCSNFVVEMWRRRGSSWTLANENMRSDAQLDGWMTRMRRAKRAS